MSISSEEIQDDDGWPNLPEGCMESQQLLYVVVFFPKERDYSEIPTSWLSDDKSYCWWPKSKVPARLMEKNIIPDEKNGLWSKYECVVESFCYTLESARKKAEDSSYTSSEEAAEVVGRGYRTKFSRHYSTDFSPHSSDSDRYTPPPNFPELANKRSPSRGFTQKLALIEENTPHLENRPQKFRQLVQTNKQPQQIIHALDEIPVVIAGPSNLADVGTSSELTINNINQGQFLDAEVFDQNLSNTVLVSGTDVDKIIKKLTSIQLYVESISKRLETLERNLPLQVLTPQLGEFEVLATLLPINSEHEVFTFETFLQTSENRKLFFDFLKRIGGKDFKESIKRMLNKTFRNDFGVKCSWFGRKKNFQVCNLKLMGIIKDTVLSLFPMCTERDFNEVGSDWFRFSKQRLQRQK
ncbi:hypothetical protein RN001_003772 [Aquatica leii]|uniref:DUF4806 domain-containing protein n=1 Tax=Aquatica leii TaxID=1421715 RepID=A0AAN7PP77_9COLE|nr:hypothetical protein RN001_003772 [Aquatica leii]